MYREIRITLDLLDDDVCLLRETVYLPLVYAEKANFNTLHSLVREKLLIFLDEIKRRDRLVGNKGD